MQPYIIYRKLLRSVPWDIREKIDNVPPEKYYFNIMI